MEVCGGLPRNARLRGPSRGAESDTGEAGISGLVGQVGGWQAMRQLGIQTVGPPMGAVRVAKELRRQERGSDFTGYTTNFTFRSLVEFLRLVGGSRWEVSLVPVSWIKCWHTDASLKEIYRVAGSGADRSLLENRVRGLANRLREGRKLPGILLTRSERGRNSHWILDGHRRLLAHRVARASAIRAYHPVGMFGGGSSRKVPFAKAR